MRDTPVSCASKPWPSGFLSILPVFNPANWSFTWDGLHLSRATGPKRRHRCVGPSWPQRPHALRQRSWRPARHLQQHTAHRMPVVAHWVPHCTAARTPWARESAQNPAPHEPMRPDPTTDRPNSKPSRRVMRVRLHARDRRDWSFQGAWPMSAQSSNGWQPTKPGCVGRCSTESDSGKAHGWRGCAALRCTIDP